MKQLLLIPLLLVGCKGPMADNAPEPVKDSDPPMPDLTGYEPKLGAVDVFVTTEDPQSLRIEFGPLIGTRAEVIKNWSKESPTLIVRTTPNLAEYRDASRSDD